MVQLSFDRPAPQASPARTLLVAGIRGSGKTRWLIERIEGLLAAGVPARRILVVTFSPRSAARIAAYLPAEVDAERPNGLWLQTAGALCRRLLRDCLAAPDAAAPRIISAFERATLLHAAAERVRAALEPGHALLPALSDTGGLSEIELLIEAVAAQGGDPDDLRTLAERLPAASLDRAVLDGVARVFAAYRQLCQGVGGLTYQEVAARAAALLADPSLAEPIAARIDHLLIDDLDRAEPMQVEALARIASRATVAATVDPSALFSDRARRAAESARQRLDLDMAHPHLTLAAPSAIPTLTRLRARLNHHNVLPTNSLDVGADGIRPGSSDRGGCHPPLPSHAPITVAEEQLDSSEAVYVARAARDALRGVEPCGDGTPDVLIAVPVPALRAPLLAALRAEHVEAVDAAGSAGAYDTAVRYVLAWLALAASGHARDDDWEAALSSPHARMAVSDAARLRDWAAQKDLTLDEAVTAAAASGCESLTDTARERLIALARLRDELRRSVRGGEAPGVTLHRLLACEDLVGALLVGPTDAGAIAPSPRGLGGLCDLIARLEALWPRAYGRAATLSAVLDRVRQGMEHLLERGEELPAGRVVVADLESAADWSARVVVVPGLCETHLPRPRQRSPLLSEQALDLLRRHWALPWPADFAAYAQGERRALDLAIAAARERVVLTRALRYDGEDAAVPSPLLLDALNASAVDAAACRAAGAVFERWSVTHEPAGDAAAPERRVPDLLALPAAEAARDLEALLYHHARRRAARDDGEAQAFLDEAGAILAQLGAPVRACFLSLTDPYPRLAAADCATPGMPIAARELNEYLYCPRRFFYSSLARLRGPESDRMSYGLLVGRAAQALHRLHPTPGAATVEDAEEVLRALWEGEAVPGDEVMQDAESEAFAGRFGPRLHAEAMRALAGRVLKRLAGASSHAQFGRRTRAVGVRVETPFALPDGRTVRVTATIDRITEKEGADGAAVLSLIDYSSGAADRSATALIAQFLNRDEKPEWRPSDYTLPLMFLGVAQQDAIYARYDLPRRAPVRELAVAALGKNKGGYPSYSMVPIVERGPAGAGAITLDELRELRRGIGDTVAAACRGPHPAQPARSYGGCDGCAHRFVCDGPEAAE